MAACESLIGTDSRMRRKASMGEPWCEPALFGRHRVATDQAQKRRHAPWRLPGDTLWTLTTRRADPHDHSVALPHRRHIGARRTNRAGPLVATDCRVVGVVTEKAVEVGAANAAAGDIDDRQSGLGRGLGHFEQGKRAVGGDETGLHGRSVPPNRESATRSRYREASTRAAKRGLRDRARGDGAERVDDRVQRCDPTVDPRPFRGMRGESTDSRR